MAGMDRDETACPCTCLLNSKPNSRFACFARFKTADEQCALLMFHIRLVFTICVDTVTFGDRNRG